MEKDSKRIYYTGNCHQEFIESVIYEILLELFCNLDVIRILKVKLCHLQYTVLCRSCKLVCNELK